MSPSPAALRAGNWRKSTRCESSMCVEMASVDGFAALRDSADPGVHLVFGAREWASVLAGVRAGEFDRG
jgi:hypothetical protein